MVYFKNLLICFCLLTLAACGGGGGSAGDTSVSSGAGGGGAGGSASVDLFTTAAPSLTLPLGVSNQTFAIGGGSAPYAVTTSTPAVATAVVAGTSFTVTGVSPGAARLIVTDAIGASVALAVTISSAQTIALFTTSPSSVVVAQNQPQSYSVGGGTPASVAPLGYSAASSNTSVATVTANFANTMTVTGVNIGSAIINVRDSVGTVVAISVTVTQPTTVLQVLPSTFDVAEGHTAPIDLYIYGGTGPYTTALSSDVGLASLIVIGNRLTVSVGSQTTRCISSSHVQYQTGAFDFVPVTFTVWDSFGTSSTSTMRIIDGAGACP